MTDETQGNNERIVRVQTSLGTLSGPAPYLVIMLLMAAVLFLGQTLLQGHTAALEQHNLIMQRQHDEIVVEQRIANWLLSLPEDERPRLRTPPWISDRLAPRQQE